MEFIETGIFTKKLSGRLSDEGYSDLQRFLAGYPEVGRLIRGTHGLRKVRWTSPLKSQGKRGGVRVIYYRFSAQRIYMLDIYRKDEQDNLSIEQLRILCRHVKGSA